MKSRSQSEHEEINRREYPGTRQLCKQCGEPTGRCEDDSLYEDEEGEIGPLCEDCFDIANSDSLQRLVRCIGRGGKGEGCGWVSGKSGGVCTKCGGMLLSADSLAQSEVMASRWRKEAANAPDQATAEAAPCSEDWCQCRDPRTVWNETRKQWICEDCKKPENTDHEVSLLSDQDGLPNQLHEMTIIAKANARLKAKNWERLQEALSDLKVVEKLARLAPEINPSNYDHDDVCRLNDIMCELYNVVRKYRTEHHA